MTRRLPDTPTLVAISALAYVIAVGLHEHLGHATACVLLGSHPVQLGAFYVECDDTRLTATGVRLVALAGPAVSLLLGIVSLLVLPRLPRDAARAFYFVWLLGTLGLMSATGYPLFSGISGIGDLGTGSDGALQGAQPEWLWRAALTLLGAASYLGVVLLSLRLIAPRLHGDADARLAQGKRVMLVSYITGAVVYVLIGVLNPLGVIIVLESVLPSSLGGTSGLFWMMNWLDASKPATGPSLNFERSAVWIALACAVTIAYAVVLGPTLRP